MSEKRQFIIPCRIERAGCDVLVTAASTEEARRKFDEMDWDSDDDSRSEIVNFEVTGEIEENR